MKKQMMCMLLIIGLLFSAQRIVASEKIEQDKVNFSNVDGIWVTNISSLEGGEIAALNDLSRESLGLAGLKAGNAETDIGMVIAVIVVVVILAGLFKDKVPEKVYDAIPK